VRKGRAVRLGLIGTGKQGQRYLLEKNGGRHITVSGSRRIPLDDVDGVIIATHPAGHKELALECIAAGKPVLIEKPLALNWADCEAILDAAERAKVPLEVAHTHLWSSAWRPPRPCEKASAVAVYVEHNRDYSAWLDWGPHVLALVADACPRYSTGMLLEHANVEKHTERQGVFCNADKHFFSGEPGDGETPMSKMVNSFVLMSRHLGGNHWAERRHFNRRVYRALFAE
jgi:hypothetical protein